MSIDNKGKRLSFCEPAVIFVEGWSDSAVIRLALNRLGWELVSKEEKKEVASYIFRKGEKRVQIYVVGGKGGMRYRLIKLVSGFEKVNKILAIKDADEDREKTRQSLENFCKNFLNDRKDAVQETFADYFVLPPVEGKELEDYLLEKLKHSAEYKEMLLKLEKCLRDISENEGKFLKRVFYSFLLFSKNCNYEGTSLRGDMLYSCLKKLSIEIPEVEEKMAFFLAKI